MTSLSNGSDIPFNAFRTGPARSLRSVHCNTIFLLGIPICNSHCHHSPTHFPMPGRRYFSY